jgi:Pyridoxamine 5'-phosphate oxidase
MVTASSLIPAELVELVASGVDVYVATRDAELEPESMMAMGVRVHRELGTITVYLPTALADETLRNLEDNGQIAVTMIRPSDFKAVQLKGVCRSVRPSTETDREFQSIFRAALVGQLEIVGVPRCISRRFLWWPSVAVELTVQEAYGQTPGPAAGEPLARGAA